jgi:hypothetical protein
MYVLSDSGGSSVAYGVGRPTSPAGASADTRAILIDFGAAHKGVRQKSQELEVILNPGYAPPEQYRPGGNHGPHTDIYACAVTLYRCLKGLKPPEAPKRK